MRRRSMCFQGGFSLVELMVALVFTLFLMAGLSVVFKSSLSSFVTSGEKLSSIRRNRLVMDLLSDDLNVAGQYLTLDAPPNCIVDTNPGFCIKPSATFSGSDELMFYFDDPLPGEGTFKNDQNGLAYYVAHSEAPPVGSNIDIDFGEQAGSVKAGMWLITRGNYEYKRIASASANGSTCTLTLDGVLGEKHLSTEKVLVARLGQYVRYGIVNKNWDPENPSASIPCLVREQGAYPGSGIFTPDDSLTTIMAENVSKFVVSMSADRGAHWVTGDNWDAIKSLLNAQLATSGAPGYTSIGNSPHWYRYAPILVKVDVTTRTATQRAEYSPTGNALAYKEHTQSLIMLPRHFGLNF